MLKQVILEQMNAASIYGSIMELPFMSFCKPQ